MYVTSFHLSFELTSCISSGNCYHYQCCKWAFSDIMMHLMDLSLISYSSSNVFLFPSDEFCTFLHWYIDIVGKFFNGHQWDQVGRNLVLLAFPLLALLSKQWSLWGFFLRKWYIIVSSDSQNELEAVFENCGVVLNWGRVSLAFMSKGHLITWLVPSSWPKIGAIP